MTDRPDDMPPWRHIDNAEILLTRADQHPSLTWPETTGESKTDILLAALTHAVIALAKTMGRQRL